MRRQMTSANEILINDDYWINKFNSISDALIGYLDTEDNILTIYCDNKIREDLEVWGSWNKWISGYKLTKYHIASYNGNYSWFIDFPNIDDFDNIDEYLIQQMPKYGKHHYKLKKNGEWIEPTENDLREKDADGNWNFVLFIHP